MGFGDFLGDIWKGFGKIPQASRDYIPQAYDWLNNTPGTEQADRDRGQIAPYLQQGNPYVSGASPQQGNYNALIKMLQERASGSGPSVAGDAYKQASDNSMNNAMALSHGSSPGAARAALQQIGGINQGLAQGYASARNQEMSSATGQLGGAIGSADNSQLQRDKANQEAWLNMLAQQLGLTRQQIGSASDKSNADQVGGIIGTLGKLASFAG